MGMPIYRPRELRRGPDAVAGDLRLLFAMVDGKPVATLYKPVDAQAPATEHMTFESPVGRVHMDCVREIPGAKVAVKTGGYKQRKDGLTMDGLYWTLEAAVPWADLGLAAPAPGVVIRGDFGYLRSDDGGGRTVGREYWSGKGQTAVSDTPSEARLCPALWGEFVVTKPDKRLRFTAPVGLLDAAGGLMKDEDDRDLLEELGE